ncbi:hypothetical protein [Brevibacillus reuszeri]|uniref:hypothetical protein n=1 Tax=Brevibacillus reuszeri TaxID=54915 RepID=UPI0013DF6F80|nr:hypothetical protein [Brevibacillus reuszeri]
MEFIRKKGIPLLLAVILAVSGVISSPPITVSAIDANTSGFNVGWLDRAGTATEEAGRVNIAGPTFKKEDLSTTLVDMYVDGKKQGTALHFADRKAVADNGYIFGTHSDAEEWAKIFNGNPSYANTWNGGVYAHDFTNLSSVNVIGNMKNLAKVAESSGGWGEYDHSAIYDMGGGKYRRKEYFFTTPRPTREVKTDKTTYQPNEVVKITASATDFSKFNKGVEVLNLSVINKTSGRGYVQFGDVIKYYKEPTGQHVESFTWNNNGKVLEYKPPVGGHEAGTYEVQFLIVDSKKRANQGAPDIRTPTPAIATFTVGGGPPAAVCAKINVHSGTKASDPIVTAGSTQIVTVGEVARFLAETNGAGAKGDWKVEGYPAFNVNNSATFSFSVPNSPGQVYKITYSLPGSNEICLTTYVKADMQGSIPCPPSDPSQAQKMDITHKLNSGSSEATEYSVITPHATANVSVKVVAEYMNSKQEKVTIRPSSGGGGGSWYVDGAPAKASAVTIGGTSLIISEYAISISENDNITFKIEYRGNDGKVWCYNVTLTTEKKVKPGEPKCPIVYNNYVGGEQLSSGTTIYRTPDTVKLDFHVVYHDGRDANQPYPVNWEIVYPDGTVKRWPLQHDDRRDRYVPYETDNFLYQASYNQGLPKNDQVWFDKAGTYKIRHDGHKRFKEIEDIDCPPWEMNIVISTAPPDKGCEGFEIGSVTVDGEKVNFSSGTGTPSNPYILHVAPGELNETVFEALYQGSPSAKVYWFVQSSYGTYGETAYQLKQTFNQGPEKVPDGFLITVSREDPKLGGETCFTIKVVWGYPPGGEFDCDNLDLRLKVNGTFESKNGSGTQANPYKLKLTTGTAFDVEAYALMNGSSKGIQSVNWELTSSKGTSTSTGNPFTKRFSESSPVTYTLKATMKGKGITCIQYIEITVTETTCDDLYIHLWTSSNNRWTYDQGGSSSNNGEGKVHPFVTSTGSLDIKLAVSDADKSNRLKVTWTAVNKVTGQVIANKASSPAESFEANALSTGTYVIKAKVVDTRYPALLNCELAITVKILNTSEGCDAIYVHVFDKFGDVWTEKIVKSGATINYPTSPDVFSVILWNTPEPLLDKSSGFGFYIESSWTSSPALENLLPDDVGFSPSTPVAEGSYQIAGSVIDKDWPNAQDCTYTITLEIGKGKDPPPDPEPCTTCEPGGEIPGGKMKIKVYDSDDRLLQSTADGTWEKEPARIEVEVNQGQINAAFAQIDQEIAQAIVDMTAYYEAKYPDSYYENVSISVNPTSWNAQSNSLTRWPGSFPMTVLGPGIDRNYSLNPKSAVQSQIYDGTTVPTLTTWALQLNAEDYVVKTEAFEVEVPYKVDFEISYELCSGTSDPSDPDAPAGDCAPGTDRGSIQNTFTIKVTGDDTKFEVYEPNAKGVLLHTPEWIDKHSRDRYKSSTNSSYYAGETILTHMIFEPRHKHPFSNQYPVILSATSWMQEKGGKNTDLRNSLNLVKVGQEWHGPSISVPKLGNRENGVDTLKMGDVWSGLQRGNYAVFFLPRFKFGVDKGYPVYDKTQLRGHNMDDYKLPIEILGNAAEWQAYKTHYK